LAYFPTSFLYVIDQETISVPNFKTLFIESDIICRQKAFFLLIVRLGHITGNLILISFAIIIILYASASIFVVEKTGK